MIDVQELTGGYSHMTTIPLKEDQVKTGDRILDIEATINKRVATNGIYLSLLPVTFSTPSF